MVPASSMLMFGPAKERASAMLRQTKFSQAKRRNNAVCSAGSDRVGSSGKDHFAHKVGIPEIGHGIVLRCLGWRLFWVD